MKAADIMTRMVITTTADATLKEAAQLMVQHRISGLPVLGAGGNVIGMLTEGDLMRRCELGTDQARGSWLESFFSPGRVARQFVRSHARRVDEVMSGEVFCVAAESPLSEVVGLMEAKNIKRVPVIGQEGLIGIVSRSDLLRALITRMPERAAEEVPDDIISRQLIREIAAQPWAPSVNMTTSVKNGVVQLSGTVTDERERTGLRVIAENIPGVKSVTDQLVCIEPMTGVIIERPGMGSDVAQHAGSQR